MVVWIGNLIYYYPRCVEPVLKGIDLKVNSGECMLITGSTGSGKTTLLALLRGLLSEMGGKLDGEIIIFGRSIIGLPPSVLGSQVGYQTQNPSTQLHQKTVLQELSSGPSYMGLPQNVCKERAYEIAHRLCLESLLFIETDTLSTGQQQLVALASILTMNCPILLLDEPTAYLDPWAEQHYINVLKEEKQKGTTILIATHQPEKFLSIADAQVVMSNGQIKIQGKLLEVIASKISIDALGESLYVSAFKHFTSQKDVLEPITWFDIDDTILNKLITTRETQTIGGNLLSDNTGIYLENISSEVLGTFALREINLKVHPGSLSALIGPNGSGKTTLARLLLGFTRVKKGRLFINGNIMEKSMTHIRARQIGYACQNPVDMLFASNVLAECEFRPKMLKYNDPHLEAEKIISTIGIKQFIDRDPNSLSGGQQRLVSLAAGLSGLPQSIVVDEPEFALDPYYRAKIWQLLRQIADNGHAVLVITHDLDNIALYVDWVAFVFNGRIIKQGEKISNLMTDNTIEKFLNIPSCLSAIGRSVEFSKREIPFRLKDKNNDNFT